MLRVAFFAFLLATPLASADWLQAGGTPEKTGQAAGPGLDWPDVALQVPFRYAYPSQLLHVPSPLIIQGHVYAIGKVSDGGTTHALFRLDPSSGVLDPVHSFDHDAYGMASNGEVIVAAGDGVATVVGLDGSFRQRLEVVGSPSSDGFSLFPECAPPAFGVALVIACVDWTGQDIVVRAFDAATFDPLWRWSRATAWSQSTAPIPSFPLRNVDAEVAVQGVAIGAAHAFVSVSMAGNVGAKDTDAQEPKYIHEIHAIDLATGEKAWSVESGAFAEAVTLARGMEGLNVGAGPLVRGEQVLFEQHSFVRYLDQETGATESSYLLREGPAREGDRGSGFAWDGVHVFATTTDRIVALRETARRSWTLQLDAGSVIDAGPLAVAGECLYVRVHEGAAGSVLCVERQTGEIRWRHDVEVMAMTYNDFFVEAQTHSTLQIAVSGGLIAVQDNRPDGFLTVLGTTAASLVMPELAATLYPPPGQAAVLDMTGVTGGLADGPLEYRAIWGDGRESPWQPDPVLRHVYQTEGEYAARVHVRNGIGQSSSAVVTMAVGDDDPAVTIWNSPFADNYQETSFFLLGLFLTFLVAAVGLYRSGRKRRRLHRELRDLEADTKRLRGTDACEPMLAERRTRARSLFLQKKLEEAHASFLEKRIDEVQRSLRVGAVDEQLRFLSHGLVLRLKRLLADARVDAIERADFLDALDRETLPAVQRDEVRGLVESWFLRDAEAIA